MQTHDEYVRSIHEPQVVSPSLLYRLEPVGIGTPYVESLTSYMKRLAQTHHLRVVDLIAFCREQTRQNTMGSTTQKLSRIDGITRTAQIWAPLLEQLTCCEGVRYLSLLYWHPVVNCFRTLRQYQAWCPLCYAAWLEQEAPLYEPLLWRLQTVDTCLVHQRKLLDHCPNCHRKFTTLSNNAIVGFCPRCLTWLGDRAHAGLPSEPEPLAQAVGRLLSLAHPVTRLSRSTPRRVIEAVKQKTRVPYTHVEVGLHISRTALSAILAGVRLPNLDTLAHLAIYSEGALYDVFLGQNACFLLADAARLSRPLETVSQKRDYLEKLLAGPERIPALLDVAQACGFANATVLRKAFSAEYEALRQRVVEEQRTTLQAVLNGDDIITLTALARQHGYEQGEIYHRFPELCRQVSMVYHLRKLACCRQYLEDILAGDTFPTLTALCKTMNVGSHYLGQHFAPELGLIETKRQEQIWREEESAGCHLNDALASESLPPPSLNQVASDLGRSVKYLKEHFPTSSQALLDRRSKYVAEETQAVCSRIRDTVFELHRQGIYPSVDRLHAVISTWMIHGKIYRDTYNAAMTACGYSDARI